MFAFGCGTGADEIFVVDVAAVVMVVGVYVAHGSEESVVQVRLEGGRFGLVEKEGVRRWILFVMVLGYVWEDWRQEIDLFIVDKEGKKGLASQQTTQWDGTHNSSVLERRALTGIYGMRIA